MNKTFEEKMQELEGIVAALEEENLGLEASVKLYEQAKALSKELNEELDASVKKISAMVENGQVEPYFEEKEIEKDI